MIALAFIAGILTIASPCILVLIPGVMAGSVGGKLRPIVIILGLSFSFTITGISASFLGHLFTNYLRYIAIGMLVLLGLILASKRLDERFAIISGRLVGKVKAPKGEGLIGAFFLGLSLGIVWVPCAGPILGAILTLAAVQREIIGGALLLFVYSLGVGIPLLVIAYSGKAISSQIKALARYSEGARKFAGWVLITLGLTILLGLDKKITTILPLFFPPIL